MMQSASIVAPSYSNLPPTRVTLPHNLSWQEKNASGAMGPGLFQEIQHVGTYLVNL